MKHQITIKKLKKSQSKLQTVSINTYVCEEKGEEDGKKRHQGTE